MGLLDDEFAVKLRYAMTKEVLIKSIRDFIECLIESSMSPYCCVNDTINTEVFKCMILPNRDSIRSSDHAIGLISYPGSVLIYMKSILD